MKPCLRDCLSVDVFRGLYTEPLEGGETERGGGHLAVSALSAVFEHSEFEVAFESRELEPISRLTDGIDGLEITSTDTLRTILQICHDSWDTAAIACERMATTVVVWSW